MKHLNMRIFGKVQGVGFRYFATKEAKFLRLKGFVRNEPDGSVYIEVEGRKDKVNKFLEWCKNGPELAVVDQIKIEKGPLKNYQEFSII